MNYTALARANAFACAVDKLQRIYNRNPAQRQTDAMQIMLTEARAHLRGLQRDLLLRPVPILLSKRQHPGAAASRPGRYYFTATLPNGTAIGTAAVTHIWNTPNAKMCQVQIPLVGTLCRGRCKLPHANLANLPGSTVWVSRAK